LFYKYANQYQLNRSSNIEFNKLQNNNDSQITIDETSLTQEENSNSTVNTLLFGGMFTRNNLNFAQNGEHCESNMNGVVILDDNEFGDNHTYMDHKNANCESNELYKGIYLGKSRGVFNGKIMVQPDAQKINAFQANNNLLVSDNASINSKPQLEIYADDVKCSHGCTIGQLDENALFYMNTRGIRKEDARAILTFAFASEALEKISINKIEDLAKDLIAQKLKVDLSF
jgi:Fe-S cluster assembly protein SufD